MSRLHWLGHSGFLVESKGMRLAVDPWRRGPTWPATDLVGLDFLALTHGHFDHAEDAPAILRETGATGVALFEVAKWLTASGVPAEQVIDVNKGGTWGRDGWSLTMVDAVHSSGCPAPPNGLPPVAPAPGNGGSSPAKTNGTPALPLGTAIHPGGEAAGWIIRTPDDDVLYHAGDTTVFGDMALIKKLYKPKVALLPIGGHYTMGPAEGAEAVRLLGVKHVVPMHYGTFPILNGSPAELQARVGKTVQVHVLRPGEVLDLAALAGRKPVKVALKTKPKVKPKKTSSRRKK